jgi:hypothetical protein
MKCFSFTYLAAPAFAATTSSTAACGNNEFNDHNNTVSASMANNSFVVDYNVQCEDPVLRFTLEGVHPTACQFPLHHPDDCHAQGSFIRGTDEMFACGTSSTTAIGQQWSWNMDISCQTEYCHVLHTPRCAPMNRTVANEHTFSTLASLGDSDIITLRPNVMASLRTVGGWSRNRQFDMLEMGYDFAVNGPYTTKAIYVNAHQSTWAPAYQPAMVTVTSRVDGGPSAFNQVSGNFYIKSYDGAADGYVAVDAELECWNQTCVVPEELRWYTAKVRVRRFATSSSTTDARPVLKSYATDADGKHTQEFWLGGTNNFTTYVTGEFGGRPVADAVRIEPVMEFCEYTEGADECAANASFAYEVVGHTRMFSQELGSEVHYHQIKVARDGLAAGRLRSASGKRTTRASVVWDEEASASASASGDSRRATTTPFAPGQLQPDANLDRWTAAPNAAPTPKSAPTAPPSSDPAPPAPEPSDSSTVVITSAPTSAAGSDAAGSDAAGSSSDVTGSSTTGASDTSASGSATTDNGTAAPAPAPVPSDAARAAATTAVRTKITLEGLTAAVFEATKAECTKAIADTLGAHPSMVSVTVSTRRRRRRLLLSASVDLDVQVFCEPSEATAVVSRVAAVKADPATLARNFQAEGVSAVVGATLTAPAAVANQRPPCHFPGTHDAEPATSPAPTAQSPATLPPMVPVGVAGIFLVVAVMYKVTTSKKCTEKPSSGSDLTTGRSRFNA